MMNKAVNILLSILLFTCSGLFAQQQGKKEQIEAQRAAFFSEKIGFSPKEAQQFWPLYNDFQQKRDDLRKTHKRSDKQRKAGIDQMSDQEVENALNDEINFRTKEAELSKEFHNTLLKILPPRKVLMYYQAEDDFKIWLLKKYGGK